jgi:hypothetical protein
MPCAADIDPRASRHLAVHHQPLLIELVEMVPVGPVRHEVGIGDQDARRVLVRTKHADRLARLDEQGLVVLELCAARDDAVEALPVSARRGRCRHRPRAPAASRRHQDRDCSSACAAALRSASSWRVSSVPVAARMVRGIVEAGRHRLAPVRAGCAAATRGLDHGGERGLQARRAEIGVVRRRSRSHPPRQSSSEITTESAISIWSA